MARISYSHRAETQLLALFSQIALAASPQIASRYIDAIYQQCEGLCMFPMRGTTRNDLYPGLRICGFRKRVSIAFEVTGDLVNIVGIFYGGQNLTTAFREEAHDDGQPQGTD